MPDVSVVVPVDVHVIVPVFNEAGCLEQSIHALMQAFHGLGPFCVYLVDDGSTDGSRRLMDGLEQKHPDVIHVLENRYGRGKGGAVRTALDRIEYGLVGIHDADLEYNPEDLADMFQLLQRREQQLVVGSRFLGKNRFLRFQRLQNQLLTGFASVFFPGSFTDIAACYKVFDASLIDGHRFRFSGFGFDYELIVLLLKRSACFVEVPVRFNPRDIGAGKKLKPRHGVSAVFAFLVTYLSVWRYPEVSSEQVGSG